VFGLEPPVLQIDVAGDDLSYETVKSVREKYGEEEEQAERKKYRSFK
jgi:hypothetical protein